MKAGMNRIILDLLLKYAHDLGVVALNPTGPGPSSSIDNHLIESGNVEWSLAGLKVRTPPVGIKPMPLFPTVVIRSLEAATGVEIEADLSSWTLSCTDTLVGKVCITPEQCQIPQNTNPQFQLYQQPQESAAIQESWFSSFRVSLASVSLTLDLGEFSKDIALEIKDILCVTSPSSTTISVGSLSLTCSRFQFLVTGIGSTLKKGAATRVTVAEVRGTLNDTEELGILFRSLLATASSSTSSGTSGLQGTSAPYCRIDRVNLEARTSDTTSDIIVSDLALFTDSVAFSSLDINFLSLNTSLSLPTSTLPFGQQLPQLQATLHTRHDAYRHSTQQLLTLMQRTVFEMLCMRRLFAEVGLLSAAAAHAAVVCGVETLVFVVTGVGVSGCARGDGGEGTGAGIGGHQVGGIGGVREIHGCGEGEFESGRVVLGRISGRMLRVELGVGDIMCLSMEDPVWSFGVCVSVGGSVYGKVAIKIERNTAAAGGGWTVRGITMDPGHAVVVCDNSLIELAEGHNLVDVDKEPRMTNPGASFEVYEIRKVERRTGDAAYLADGQIPVQKLQEIPIFTPEFAQDEEDTSNTEKLLSDWQRDFGWLDGLIPDLAHLEIQISNFTCSITERKKPGECPTTVFVITLSDVHILNGMKPTGQISISEGCIIPDHSQNSNLSGEQFLAWIKLGKDFADDSIHSLRVGQYYANVFANIEKHHLAKLKRIYHAFTTNAGSSGTPSFDKNIGFEEKITNTEFLPNLGQVDRIIVDLADNLEFITEELDERPPSQAERQTLLFSTWYAPLESFRELTYLLDSNRGDPGPLSRAATTLALLTALLSTNPSKAPLSPPEPDQQAQAAPSPLSHSPSRLPRRSSTTATTGRTIPSSTSTRHLDKHFSGKRLVLGREGLDIRLPSPTPTTIDNSRTNNNRFALVCSLTSHDLECWKLLASTFGLEKTPNEFEVVLIMPFQYLHIDIGEYSPLSRYVLTPAFSWSRMTPPDATRLFGRPSVFRNSGSQRDITVRLVDSFLEASKSLDSTSFKQICFSEGLAADIIPTFPKGQIYKVRSLIQVTNKLDWDLWLDGKYHVPARSSRPVPIIRQNSLSMELIRPNSAPLNATTANPSTKFCLASDKRKANQHLPKQDQSGFFISVHSGSQAIPAESSITIGGSDGSHSVLDTLQTGFGDSSLPVVLGVKKSLLKSYPKLCSVEITIAYLMVMENYTDIYYSGGKYPFTSVAGYGWAENTSEGHPASVFIPKTCSFEPQLHSENCPSPKQVVPITIPTSWSLAFFPQPSVEFFITNILPRLVPLLHVAVMSNTFGYSQPSQTPGKISEGSRIFTAPISVITNRSLMVPDICPLEKAECSTEAPMLDPFSRKLQGSKAWDGRSNMLLNCTLVNTGAQNSPVLFLLSSHWNPAPNPKIPASAPKNQPNLPPWIYLPQSSRLCMVDQTLLESTRENASLEIKKQGFVALEEPKIISSRTMKLTGTFRVAGICSGSVEGLIRCNTTSTHETNYLLEINNLRTFKDTSTVITPTEGSANKANNPATSNNNEGGPLLSTLNLRVETSSITVRPLGLRVFSTVHVHGGKVFASPQRLQSCFNGVRTVLAAFSPRGFSTGGQSSAAWDTMLEALPERHNRYLYEAALRSEAMRRDAVLASRCERIFPRSYIKLLIASDLSLVLSDGNQLKAPVRLSNLTLQDVDCADVFVHVSGQLATRLLPSLIKTSPMTLLRTALSYTTSSQPSDEFTGMILTQKEFISLNSRSSFVFEGTATTRADAILGRFRSEVLSIKKADTDSSEDTSESTSELDSSEPQELAQVLITVDGLVSTTDEGSSYLPFPIKLKVDRSKRNPEVFRVIFTSPNSFQSSPVEILTLKPQLTYIKAFFSRMGTSS